MNILIPMAGNGSRFSSAGYRTPKFLLPIGDEPMIQRVVQNVDPKSQYPLITVFRYENMSAIQGMFMGRTPAMFGKSLAEPTGGAVETVLHAREKIDNQEELVIANSDQLVDINMEKFYDFARGFDAAILCFEVPEDEPAKWSYACLREAEVEKISNESSYPSWLKYGLVEKVAEKDPISNIATVGIYYFKKGSEFVKAAQQMMSKDIMTNGEFYVCPVFNEIIANGGSVGAYIIPNHKMHGLGTPADYENYLKEEE